MTYRVLRIDEQLYGCEELPEGQPVCCDVLLEDETGERYWLFRSGDGEHEDSGSQKWFLHGIFA